MNNPYSTNGQYDGGSPYGANPYGQNYPYGNPGSYYQPYQENIYAQPGESGGVNGLAIGSLVCGIISIICCCTSIFSVLLGITAIVLAVLSKKDNGGAMPGMAIAGMICGVIGMLLGAMILVGVILDEAGISVGL